MAEHYPVLILLAPFFAAIAVSLLGGRWAGVCLPLVLGALSFSLAVSIALLGPVAADGEVVYNLGGWPRPFGIEFRIDALNAILLVVINTVSLLTAIYSIRAAAAENPDKRPQFYTLFLLLITGLLGMSLTGDAFNLYVLLEVSSLTSYALIAMSSRRAVLASFNYIIMGTMGASFYLLGVGYLYIQTGSLNMVDIGEILRQTDLYGSKTILVAFMLILVGVWIKMAFFPLHGWLPNAYAYAPSSAGCVLAPLVTKVTIYVMIRLMMTVFGPEYVFAYLGWSHVVVWMAVLAIVAGSILALAQINLKKMLTYLIVAEVGYMVGGVWLANETALVGAFYHVVSDAFMTLCLFLAAGAIIYKTGKNTIPEMRGLFRKMPWTMAGFVVAGLSMIGIPPTCGFFSKWYLISGAIEVGHWGYVAALLFSSLINAILFFRIFEVAYFSKSDSHGHEERAEAEAPGEAGEPPLTMLGPLLITAACLLLIGIFNQEIISLIRQAVSTFGPLGFIG